MLIALPVVLLGGVATEQCAPPPTPGGDAAGSGSWIATAYGPPWNAINGTGVTATGLNLTAGPPAYEIAVDPAVIPLQTFAHVQPNPFGTTRAFYAGDTGGAIIGRHVDIYDWKGRADQNAWGVRHVNVTPAPNPGTGNLLQEITPAPTTIASSSQPGGTIGWTPTCDQLAGTATLATVPGQTARILPDGTAAAPSDAPAAVKLAIAAANEIHTKPYPEPVAHFGSLASPWPAYDCSGAVSFVLYTRRAAQPMARRVRDARILGTPRARHVDHRVRQLGAHVDRDRRARVRHRRLRRPEHPRRQRPPLAARPTREPRRRTHLRRPPSRPDYDSRADQPHVPCLARARAREASGRDPRRPPRRGRARRLRRDRQSLPDRRHRHAAPPPLRRPPRPPTQAIPRQSATEPSQPRQQAAIDRLGAGAARTSPQAALARYAAALRQLDRRRRRRRTSGSSPRSHSGKPERRRSKPPRASPAIPSSPRARSRTPAPSSRSPPGKAPPPDSGCSSPASRPPGRATTPACRRPCTSSTPS